MGSWCAVIAERYAEGLALTYRSVWCQGIDLDDGLLELLRAIFVRGVTVCNTADILRAGDRNRSKLRRAEIGIRQVQRLDNHEGKHQKKEKAFHKKGPLSIF